MDVVRHTSAGEFLEKSGPWLEQAEVKNNLILGIAAYFASFKGELKTQPYYLTIKDNEAVVGAALMAPPRQLLITEMPETAVNALVDYLLAASAPVPGVVGANATATRFAKHWSSRTGQTSRLRMSERLHECTAVLPVRYAPGRLRPAHSDDQPRLTEWAERYCIDAHLEDEIPFFKARLPHKIAGGSIVVWEDGKIVSMAGVERERPRGAAIAYVFTPSHLRGQGYATSCVAALTQRLLDSGKRFCCLYTDLANPISNSIYRKIGYREICDAQYWVFE